MSGRSEREVLFGNGEQGFGRGQPGRARGERQGTISSGNFVGGGIEQRKCKEVLPSTTKGASSSRVKVHRGPTQNTTELVCQVLCTSIYRRMLSLSVLSWDSIPSQKGGKLAWGGTHMREGCPSQLNHTQQDQDSSRFFYGFASHFGRRLKISRLNFQQKC